MTDENSESSTLTPTYEQSKTSLESFGKNENDNCLKGIECPNCGWFKSFKIEVVGIADVWDDGFDVINSPDFTDESWCMCSNCEYENKFGEFYGGKS